MNRTLIEIKRHQAYYRCFKWPNIAQVIQPSGHTDLSSCFIQSSFENFPRLAFLFRIIIDLHFLPSSGFLSLRLFVCLFLYVLAYCCFLYSRIFVCVSLQIPLYNGVFCMSVLIPVFFYLLMHSNWATFYSIWSHCSFNLYLPNHYVFISGSFAINFNIRLPHQLQSISRS